jgi:hypothetical protein
MVSIPSASGLVSRLIAIEVTEPAIVKERDLYIEPSGVKTEVVFHTKSGKYITCKGSPATYLSLEQNQRVVVSYDKSNRTYFGFRRLQ